MLREKTIGRYTFFVLWSFSKAAATLHETAENKNYLKKTQDFFAAFRKSITFAAGSLKQTEDRGVAQLV